MVIQFITEYSFTTEETAAEHPAELVVSYQLFRRSVEEKLGNAAEELGLIYAHDSDSIMEADGDESKVHVYASDLILMESRIPEERKAAVRKRFRSIIRETAPEGTLCGITIHEAERSPRDFIGIRKMAGDNIENAYEEDDEELLMIEGLFAESSALRLDTAGRTYYAVFLDVLPAGSTGMADGEPEGSGLDDFIRRAECLDTADALTSRILDEICRGAGLEFCECSSMPRTAENGMQAGIRHYSIIGVPEGMTADEEKKLIRKLALDAGTAMKALGRGSIIGFRAEKTAIRPVEPAAFSRDANALADKAAKEIGEPLPPLRTDAEQSR